MKFLPLILKQVWRHRTRSALTIAGVAIAMFLYIGVQSLNHGVTAATQVTAADTTLIVYRANRFCPATSRLPEHYQRPIAELPGVASVVPMQIVVNNCRASLDVITFRGIQPDALPDLSSKWKLLEGSLEEWGRRSDAAIVGERLARRRGFRVGQSFDSSGVTVSIAAIIRSAEAQDQEVAYVHLDFLQRAAAKDGVGTVTQFSVKVTDPSQLESVAKAIDDRFKHDAEPTQTRPEKAFVAQAGADIVAIAGFTRWLGWGCLAAVLALVANAIVLSVQDRIKEHAVLQTLGYRGSLIARLILTEGLVLGLIGGITGTIAATLALRLGGFSLSTEGLSIQFAATPKVIAIGLLVSGGVGIVAGLVPALRAGRRTIASCFRAV